MKNNKTLNFKTNRLTIALFLFSTSHLANAADVTLSNYSYYTSGRVITHTVGSSTSEIQWNSASYAPYASFSASSSYLSLNTSSSIDAQHIDQLGYDYVVAEGNANFIADLVISGGTGTAYLNIDTFYNETSTKSPGATIYGEQNIRIIDNTNNTNYLVFSYLNGLSDSSELTNIALNFGSTYRFEMWSSAYSKADVFTSASNQRDFTAALSVSAVPLPSAAWMFGSCIIGLGGLACKRKVTNTNIC